MSALYFRHRGDRIRYGKIVAAFLRAGWRPPRPSSRVVSMIAEDIEAKTRENWNWAPTLELTTAELRAVTLLAEGLSEEEAAAEVGVAHATMRNQRRSAYSRLGARNGPHAVAIAMRRGILT